MYQLFPRCAILHGVFVQRNPVCWIFGTVRFYMLCGWMIHRSRIQFVHFPHWQTISKQQINGNVLFFQTLDRTHKQAPHHGCFHIVSNFSISLTYTVGGYSCSPYFDSFSHIRFIRHFFSDVIPSKALVIGNNSVTIQHVRLSYPASPCIYTAAQARFTD